MDKKTYNEERLERIERFLREQMSPEETKEFIKALKNDKELREDAQMMAQMIKAMGITKEREEQHIVRSIQHYSSRDGKRIGVEVGKPSACQARTDCELSSSSYAGEPEYADYNEERMELSPAAATEIESPAVIPLKTASRTRRFMKWALPIAAMVVLAFGAIKFTSKKGEAQLAVNEVATKEQPSTKKQANEDAITVDEKQVADTPVAALSEPDDEEVVMDGGTLPNVENVVEPKVQNMLADIDKAIEEKQDLQPFINEMQDIIDGLKESKAEYAQFKPYQEKIEWRLTAALTVDGDDCLAKEVLDDIAEADNPLAVMLRKKYQCNE